MTWLRVIYNNSSLSLRDSLDRTKYIYTTVWLNMLHVIQRKHILQKVLAILENVSPLLKHRQIAVGKLPSKSPHL